MAAREPIDDLIDALPQTPPEDEENIVNEESNSSKSATSNEGQINMDSSSNSQGNTSHTQLTSDSSEGNVTPTRNNHLIIKNLSSSSLRKRKVKPVNCKFCFRYTHNREQLERHLNENEVCCLLYQRENRVSSLDAVLVKTFKCISCTSIGNYQLKKHLESNPNCMHYYQQRFNVQSWMEIKVKMYNLIRSSFPCNSKAKRKLVNESWRAKKKDAITITQGLNDFKKEVSLSNYRLCVTCDQFFLASGAKEIMKEDPKYVELDLENKQMYKRMNKFWLCNCCLASSSKRESKFSEPKMKLVTIDGYNILGKLSFEKKLQTYGMFHILVSSPLSLT